MSRFPLPRFASLYLVEWGGNRWSGGCGGMQHPPIIKSAHFCTMSPAHGASFSGQGCAWLCVCDAKGARGGAKRNFSFYFSGIFLCTLCSLLPSFLASCCNCQVFVVAVVVVIVAAAVVVVVIVPCCVFIVLWVQRNDAYSTQIHTNAHTHTQHRYPCTHTHT